MLLNEELFFLRRSIKGLGPDNVINLSLAKYLVSYITTSAERMIHEIRQNLGFLTKTR